MKTPIKYFFYLLLLAIIVCQGSSCNRNGKDASSWRFVKYVNPLISTENPRWDFFAAACTPFGMVSLCPDTKIKGGTWNTGYCYKIDSIRWFSHVHDWQLAGIPVMPVTGSFKGTSGSDAYRSKFSHEKETVYPGYHSVVLDDYNIRVELTSTKRVGFHRYTFPKSEQSHILFDLGAELGPSQMSDVFVRQTDDSEFEGYVENAPTLRRPKPCKIYFVIRFNKPFNSLRAWKDSKELGIVNKVSGKNTGVYVSYSTQENEVIMLKVAISYVSEEQARLNMIKELPHWDFDVVSNHSTELWNRWLGVIEVEGGTEEQKIKFYTDLWHVLLGRHMANDANGKYSDMTGTQRIIRQIPLDEEGNPLYDHYNTDGFWGSQWTLNVLWTLAYPQVTNKFINWMLDMYKNGGLIPRGPSGGNYTFAMTSASPTPFIVSAYMKGIRDYDVNKAYEGMRKNHFPGGLMSKAGYEHYTCIGGGVEYYIERGYVPLGIEAEAYHVDGAGQTLEYAYDDWCLAQMAKSLGKEDDYKLFIKRAGNYKNLFDTTLKLMRPRNMDGSWLTPFDPMARQGWVEANAWQSTWYVPHDIQGLINLMGGREFFMQRLDSILSIAEKSNFVSSLFEHNLSLINYANQPSTEVAHLFNHSGAPWLTQKWVRKVKEKTFGGITPYTGYNGDEDAGQMGALGILMAIGLFDLRGGAALEPTYEITSPIFDKITIHLNSEFYSGNDFIIEARNNSKENIYIQSATLNGKPLNRPWFYHKDIVNGGHLILEMGPNPNKDWGSKPEDAPPSMTQAK